MKRLSFLKRLAGLFIAPGVATASLTMHGDAREAAEMPSTEPSCPRCEDTEIVDWDRASGVVWTADGPYVIKRASRVTRDFIDEDGFHKLPG